MTPLQFETRQHARWDELEQALAVLGQGRKAAKSRAKDGTIWTTWNYPLSYGLKLTPQFRINRQRPDQSFWQLYQSHKEYLRRHQVETSVIDPMDEERVQTEIENDLREQIKHNVAAGVLKPANEREVKYSWRGMVYLWCQFLLDLVRM